MNDQRIILFVFAGREANLRTQRPSLDRLLAIHPRAEVHYFDMTRNDEDHAYVQTLHDPANRVHVRSELYEPNDWPIGCRKKLRRPRWCGCRDCKPGQYEKVYALYAADESYADAILTKLDDDLVWFAAEHYGDVLSILAEHPNAVVSGNVVNNVVCAKHTPGLRGVIEHVFSPESQRDWFDLHADADFARISHEWFLRNGRPGDVRDVRSLPGERPSINCVSFTHATMKRLAATMANPKFAKMGDEGSICQNFLPRIALRFVGAHLYFGPQRVNMTDAELDDLRAAYGALS